MTTVALGLVLGSGMLHSIWNLFTKKSLHKHVFLWYCQLVGVFVFLPWTLMEWDTVSWGAPAALWLAASMLLHGMYVLLLAATYTVGDLSQVYPIMRGTSPLLVPIAGVALLGESITPLGWVGVLSIVAGIVLLSDVSFRRGQMSSLRAPVLALCVGVCIASYIVVDKVALQYMSPVVLNEATSVGNLLALSFVACRSGMMRRELRTNWKTILFGGIVSPGGYILFLFALSLAPVAQLAPMREIGTVFGTIWGILLLREKQGKRRLLTSLLITAGVIVLGIWGT